MKVSILISAYNEETYIEECIKSCEEQSYSNLEIIVYNDGSTDKTAEILKGFSEQNRITLIDSNINNGKIFGFNKLVEKSTGDFVHLVGADDILSRCCISCCVDSLLDNDILYHGLKVVNKTKDKELFTLINKSFAKKTFDEYLVRFDSIASGSIFFSKAAVEKIFPIPIDVPYEDIWISYNIKKLKFKVGCIERPLYFYRQNENNIWGGISNTSLKIKKFRASRDVVFIDSIKNDKVILNSECRKTLVESYLYYLKVISVINNKYQILFKDIKFATKFNFIIRTGLIGKVLIFLYIQMYKIKN